MSIEAMKQALEALERAAELLTRVGLCFKGIDKTITSLRQAIAEAEKQEPVAWADYGVLNWIADMQFKHASYLYTHPQPKQEPVGWIEKNGDLVWNNKEAAIGRNLYTHPQPKREPPKAGDGHDLFYEAVRLLDNAIFAQSGDVVRHDLAAHKEALDFFNHVFTKLDLTPSQPKREPAAWGMENDDGQIYDCITPEEHAKKEGQYTVALYRGPQPNVTTSDMKQKHVDKTAKQRHEWVGLTPEERLVIIDQWHWDEGKTDYLCRLVEEKLKEKNT